MTTLLVFILLGIAFAIGFRVLKNRAIRKAASFQLYAVRDELICLVAEDKLDENGKIFQYYYKRINRILELAPNVGLDDSIEAFLYLKKNKDFEKSLAEANKRAEEMLELVKREDECVSNVIADYYSASKNMMLAHSSFIKIIYLLIMKYHLANFLKNFVPVETKEVLRTVKFADAEEHKFRHVLHSN